MEKNLTLLFEEERKRLMEDFAPVKKAWWKSDNVKYKTTLEVASKTTYKLNKQDSYEVYYDRASNIFLLIFLLAVLAVILIFNYKNEDFNAFPFIVIAIFLFGILIYNCLQVKKDKEPIFRFDKEGMFYKIDEFYLKWVNVADTYIKYDSGGEDTIYILIVRYYDEVSQAFETKEINIGGYDQNFESIAYMITVAKNGIVF